MLELIVASIFLLASTKTLDKLLNFVVVQSQVLTRPFVFHTVAQRPSVLTLPLGTRLLSLCLISTAEAERPTYPRLPVLSALLNFVFKITHTLSVSVSRIQFKFLTRVLSAYVSTMIYTAIGTQLNQ